MVTLSSVTSNIKGFVKLSKKSDTNKFIIFQITDTTNNTDWWKLTVSHQSSSETNPFSDTDDIFLSFLTNGSKGDQGEQGLQGVQGYTGFQGFTGAQGFTGFQGFQGYTGFQGHQGFTGAQGFTGRGFQGYTGYQGFYGYQGYTGFTGEKGQKGENNGIVGQKGEPGEGADIDENTDISLNNLKVHGDLSANDVSFNDIRFLGKIYQADGTEFVGGAGAVNNSNQTFYDILTQQPNKFKKQGNPVSTTSTIDISWNFDDILATQETNTIAKLSFQSLEKNKSLPFINEIKLDISGNTSVNTSNSYTWLNLYTFNIANSSDYNTDTFKTYQIQKTAISQANNNDILNILSRTDKFDARVYGNNFANNYPDINTRALLFNGLQFVQASAPNSPIFVSENANFNSDIILTYKVDEPEGGNPQSSAVISQVITDYSQNETLSSSIYPIVTTNLTDTETENASANQNFNINLNGLRAGTKYNYKVKAKNDLRNIFSDFSTSRISNFLLLPSDNGVSTSLNFNSNQSKTYVTTPSTTANLNNSYVYYLNTALDSTFNLTNTNNQTIQITRPYTSSQQNLEIGYGKWVDNSQNLVQVECYTNSTLKQTISFNGFDTNNNNAGTASKNNSNSNIFNYFSNPSQSDIYSSANTQGFRIKGVVNLNNITSVLTNIGPAQNDKHTIEYKYIRHADVGGSALLTTTHHVYIDTLSSLPSSISPLNSSTVKSLIYTMGIPSVKTTDISMNRTYHNINSENLYIPGNRIIARISSISKTNKTSSKNITIDRNSIVSNGQYNFDFNDIKTQTNSYYYGTYYTQEINGSTSLTITENSTSLRGSSNTNSDLTVNHFFDSASYNSVGGASINRKFTYTDVYEITDATEIAKLNSDVGDIGITQYTSANTDAGHKKIPQDWTLLYLGGKFRTNANKNYPNVNNFQYNGVDSIVNGSGQYSSGTTAYSTSGSSDSNGYKWIVFKLTKSSGGYSMMGLTISIDQNGDDQKYLDLRSALSNFFNSTTIDDLFNLTNTNAIGFCRATKSGTTTKIMGSFKQSFNPIGGNWIVNGTGQKSYTDIADGSSYGSIVDDGTSGRGIYISKTAINDDLEIFIGLKNSWAE